MFLPTKFRNKANIITEAKEKKLCWSHTKSSIKDPIDWFVASYYVLILVACFNVSGINLTAHDLFSISIIQNFLIVWQKQKLYTVLNKLVGVRTSRDKNTLNLKNSVFLRRVIFKLNSQSVYWYKRLLNQVSEWKCTIIPKSYKVPF